MRAANFVGVGTAATRSAVTCNVVDSFGGADQDRKRALPRTVSKLDAGWLVEA